MANQMKQMLHDVRKMSRAIRLRGESDPEQVAEVLRVILHEAIALKASGSEVFGKSAINELRNIRRDLVAGKISPAGGSAPFIAKYSLVLDQISETEELAKKRMKEDGLGIGNAIVSNLPSVDTIAAAMITANPLIGYSAKMMVDMVRSQRRARAMARQENARRLENLKAEAEQIKEEREAVEQQVKEEMKRDPLDHAEIEKLNEMREDLGHKLDLIHEEIHHLNEIWASPSPTPIESEHIERIADAQEDSVRIERERENIERLKEREAEVERTDVKDVANPHKDNTEEAGKPFSELLVGLASGLGGIFGGFVGSLLTPFTKFFDFLKVGGAMLARLGPVALLVAAVKGIYDFVDGFLSAAKFLGQSDSETTFVERLKVGASNLISGLLAPVDWILDFFDLGFMDSQKEMTKSIIDTVDRSVESLIKFFNDPVGVIIDFFEGDGLTNMINSIKSIFTTVVPKVTDALLDVGGKIVDVLLAPARLAMEFIDNIDFDRLFGYVGGKINTALASALSTLTNAFITPIESIVEYVREVDLSVYVDKVIESVGGVFDDVVDAFKSITEGISKWFDDKIDSVKNSWLGKGVGSVVDFFTGENTSSPEDTFVDRALGNLLPKPREIPTAESARQLEEEQSSNTSNVFSRAWDGFSDWWDSRGGDRSSGGGTIIAPTTNTTVNNSTIVESSTGAKNNDRTWREVNGRNLRYGF